ncbi:MAG TPA: hypothetical protein VK918_02220 [Pyrinomonadaceae bacterium]|nr:hypothetical protein [Pyrinomonadaceae bacterium]
MTALEELKMLTDWDAEPALTETEVSDILDAAALTDEADLAADDEGWDPTYDMNRAASRAWLVKAARAASLTEADPETGKPTSIIFENCRRMATLFSSRRNATTTLR